MSLVTSITVAECALYSLLPTIMPISPAEATKEYSLPIIHFVTGPGGRAVQCAVLSTYLPPRKFTIKVPFFLLIQNSYINRSS